MTLSHEFRAPLSSTLMCLESLYESIANSSSRKIILVVICQMNLLLCLINDILDLKMIEQDKFTTKQELFDPTKTLKFVVRIFTQQAKLQNSALSFEVVPSLGDPKISSLLGKRVQK